ncbi:MAG: F0F1 ATP synthase subunit delta [Betaproteobacteria bacterium]|jgi:F-type H+-transporting ATPase subunit delta|nr:F0F1 ATP synthase subunit delta [Betaproteobacteria bacterium]
MAELRTIARPYAEAAFGLAKEENAFAAWSEALSAMAAVVAAPEMKALIGNPALAPARLAELIASAAPGLSKSQKDLLSVLAENERLAALTEISGMYETLRNEAERVLAAEVTSAYPMSDAQVAEITGLLEKKHGKKVKVSVNVDPELIGGVSIAIGDEVMDASVRGKLARMQSALTN